MLCCDRADKQLHQFYKLLFFAYEYADNQAETCQLYANQGHYLVGQQQLRTTATQDVNFKIWLISHFAFSCFLRQPVKS